MNNSRMRNNIITNFTITFQYRLESNNLSALEVLAAESKPAISERKTSKMNPATYISLRSFLLFCYNNQII
jgi:hypothetical protein